MKSGKVTGPYETSVEIIVASGEIGIKVMMDHCQHVLDGRGMPDERKTTTIAPMFKRKCDVMSCGSHRGIKLLEDKKFSICFVDREKVFVWVSREVMDGLSERKVYHK